MASGGHAAALPSPSSSATAATARSDVEAVHTDVIVTVIVYVAVGPLFFVFFVWAIACSGGVVAVIAVCFLFLLYCVHRDVSVVPSLPS